MKMKKKEQVKRISRYRKGVKIQHAKLKIACYTCHNKGKIKSEKTHLKVKILLHFMCTYV